MPTYFSYIWMLLTLNTHELRNSGRYEAIPQTGFVSVELSREILGPGKPSTLSG